MEGQHSTQHTLYKHIMSYFSTALCTGYSIFVVVGVLPPCEADQVLSLIRAEPPPPSRPVPSSSFSSSSWQEEHHQHTSRGREKRPGPQTFSSVLSGSGRPAKRGRGEDKGEKQDLQMAMALSATLEQSQEQFEIDQQLQFQRPEKGAEGTHPAISSRDEVGDYAEEDEEEEAALAAAIYASLGQCVTNSILVSVCVYPIS